MKKYLFNGIAALAMGLAITSCTKEFNYEEQQEQQALNNAEQTLGFHIPEGQDWVMSSQATANITVKGLNDNNCTLYVFSNDPMVDGFGTVLASAKVSGSNNVISNFRYPSDLESVYVGLRQSNGNTTYKFAAIENGVIIAEYDFSNVAASRTRSITVNGDTYDVFPAPTSDDLKAAFPTTIPDGAEEVSDLETLYKGKVAANGNTMWDLYAIYLNQIGKDYNLKVTKPGTVEVGNCQNGASNLYNVFVYVDGDVTIKRPQNAFYRLFILKGNVTLDSNFGEMAGLISIAEGATLNDPRNHIAANDGIKVYNRGTYNVTNTNDYWNGSANVKFDIGNNATFYNEGSFSVENGKMSYSPGSGQTSYFINMGDDATISAGGMILNSNCHFLNTGTVDIEGETFVTQSGIYWVNNGHYTTGSMIFSAKNATFYNYCQLIVKGNAHMYDGEFNLMTNSYTEAATADFDNFIVNMGSNSGFNVKGNTDWAAQGDGTYQGFRSTNASNENMYVRLGGTTTVAGHLHSLEITGNITYAINNLVDLGANNSGVKPTHVFNEGTTEAKFSELTPTVSATDCGANWGDTVIIDTIPVNPQIWTYAFEDNTLKGDYDMNDVVLKVSEDPNDDTKLIVRLVAAGCEFDNNVYLNDEEILWTNASGVQTSEVHEAFGVGKGVMVNTGNRATTANIVTTTINKPANFDFQTANFSVVPSGGESKGQHIRIATSGYPCGIVVPIDWAYPTERTNICTAYEEEGHSFGEWATTADHSVAKDWYNHPTGSVMANN